MTSTTSATGTGPVLPGRAVDIVNAAVKHLGFTPYSISASFSSDGQLEQVDLHLLGDLDEHGAHAVFAALGAPVPSLGDRYGSRSGLALLTGDVPALGASLEIIVNKLADRLPEVADPAALVAEVDAARAAVEVLCAADCGLAAAPGDVYCAGCGSAPDRSAWAEAASVAP